MAVLTSPHLETISPELMNLLAYIGQQAFAARFYLAGGTALALQLGHRRSVDLDFFSATDQVHGRTRREIIAALSRQKPEVIENADGNLLLLVDGIHVGFFSYGYPLLDPGLEFQNVRLASLLDLGLMKLDALMGRGSRKDFYDVYVLCQNIPLDDLLAAGERKYLQMRDFALMAVESLVMFDNAERDVQPELLVDLPWQSVKQYFIAQAQELGKRWFLATR